MIQRRVALGLSAAMPRGMPLETNIFSKAIRQRCHGSLGHYLHRTTQSYSRLFSSGHQARKSWSRSRRHGPTNYFRSPRWNLRYTHSTPKPTKKPSTNFTKSQKDGDNPGDPDDRLYVILLKAVGGTMGLVVGARVLFFALRGGAAVASGGAALVLIPGIGCLAAGAGIYALAVRRGFVHPLPLRAFPAVGAVGVAGVVLSLALRDINQGATQALVRETLAVLKRTDADAVYDMQSVRVVESWPMPPVATATTSDGADDAENLAVQMTAAVPQSTQHKYSVVLELRVRHSNCPAVRQSPVYVVHAEAGRAHPFAAWELTGVLVEGTRICVA